MPNSTPKGKMVEPTSFDLAVIAVVETLAGNTHLLQSGYKKFNNKGDLLEWLGINRNSWGDIQNYRRHVPNRGKTTKEMIIDKLSRQFEVRRDYLITNSGAMFKTNILNEEPQVHYKTRSQMQEEIDSLAAENRQLRKRVRELEKLTEQQSQLIEQKVRPGVRLKR